MPFWSSEAKDRRINRPVLVCDHHAERDGYFAIATVIDEPILIGQRHFGPNPERSPHQVRSATGYLACASGWYARQRIETRGPASRAIVGVEPREAPSPFADLDDRLRKTATPKPSMTAANVDYGDLREYAVDRVTIRQLVEKGRHCRLVQQCKGRTPAKILLDKPAVAPESSAIRFFNGLPE